MEQMQKRFIDAVAAKLTRAPQSAAKDELVEELSDNLYRRFLDMNGAGVPEEEAFRRSMDDLGDVDELLSYLGVEPAGNITIDMGDSQSRITTADGQRIIINDGAQKKADAAQRTADAAQARADAAQDEADAAQERADAAQGTEEEDAAQEEADAAQERADEAQEEADAAQEWADEAQEKAEAARGGRQDEGGDTHYDYQTSQSDLDAIMAGVQEACNVAIDQAKAAIQQAKEALKRRTTWEKDNGRVTVHFNTRPDSAPTPPEPPTPPTPPEPPAGWEFEAELDSDTGRFFAGAGPKEKKDVIYGFGYDKDKGGFFTQWGEYQGDSQGRTGPHFTGENSGMHPNEDGSYSVEALKDLRGIEVFTVAGDVTIHVSESADAGVIIDGDVDDLDVTCSADGVLTIREGRTASSSFFSRRGIGSADVELFIPARHWNSIRVTTTSGDVDIDKGWLDTDELSVQTGSGDLDVQLSACGQLHFKSGSGDLAVSGSCGSLYAETASGDVSFHGGLEDAVVKTASGDVDLEHSFGRLHVETISGDIQLEGQVKDAVLKSASGEIELAGPAARLMASSVSGGVRLESSVLPETMQLSSKSGDCEARIPDAGPFSVRMKTVSGEMSCEFPVNYINGVCVYGDGTGPSYSMTTVSGDVSLERY